MGRNEKTKRKPKLWWLFAAGLFLLSVLVYFIASAYEFTALIGMGIAFTIACYRRSHPQSLLRAAGGRFYLPDRTGLRRGRR